METREKGKGEMKLRHEAALVQIPPEGGGESKNLCQFSECPKDSH